MLDILWKWTHGIKPPVNCTPEDGWTSDDEDLPSTDDNLSSEDNPRPASNILWLHGPAGGGKSAITQSLCLKLEAEGCLAASSFFKREHKSRGNATRLFSTIAYQLAVLLPELNRAISEIVENDRAIVDRSLSIRLQKLITEPCQQISNSMAAC
ncbi:hypothetical protein B0H13DRAFT_1592442 [Mycena leptocephala]|nr:hypothetical protein B0H13DRAFT_1592442 [Mycena leptocephala]